MALHIAGPYPMTRSLDRLLNQAIEGKAQQWEMQKQANMLRQMGLPEQLAYMNPQMQAAYTKEFLKQPRIEAQNKAIAGYVEGGVSPEEMQVSQENVPAFAQEFAPQQQRPNLQKLLSQQREPEIPYGPEAMLQQRLGRPETMEAMQQVPMPEQQTGMQQPQEQVKQAPKEVPYWKQKERQLGDLIRSGQLDPKMSMSAQQNLLKEKSNIQKQYKEFITDTNKEYKNAKEELKPLMAQKALHDAGKLPKGRVLGIMKGLGFSEDLLEAMLGSDAQYYNKLLTQQFTHLKDQFGSRPTNFDFAQFLKGMPDLYKTEVGRGKILDTLILLKHGAVIRGEIMKDILKENDHQAIPGLEDKVDEIYAPISDQIGQQLNQIALR